MPKIIFPEGDWYKLLSQFFAHTMQFLRISLFICAALAIVQPIESSRGANFIEAGCKFWIEDRNKWGPDYGKLLQKGACVEGVYDRAIPPGPNRTLILSTIEGQRIRDIDAQKKTLTIDFSLKMRWWDYRIKTNFSTQKEELNEIPIDNRWINEIWMPNVYVYNLSNYKAFKDSMLWRSFLLVQNKQARKIPLHVAKILSNGYMKNLTDDNLHSHSQGDVEMTLEATATIYCTFDLPRYPFDKQQCKFRLGSRSSDTVFTLEDPTNHYHQMVSYQASNFFTSTTFVNDTNGAIGVDITMSRDIQSFVLKYYVTCIAIVILSNFSFVFPLTDKSGRVGLLVTLFLTLTNLFIYQMVSTLTLYCIKSFTALFIMMLHYNRIS